MARALINLPKTAGAGVRVLTAARPARGPRCSVTTCGCGFLSLNTAMRWTKSVYPQPHVVTLHLGPRAGRAAVNTRIRLADSQTITAGSRR
jgi:hypothetical protein